MNALTFEADILSGMDQLREQFPIAPALALDDPLFEFDKKAKDCNRLPVRVMEDAFTTAVVGEQRTADDYGLPLRKDVPVEEDDNSEPVELSPELIAQIEKISGYNARAAWPLVRHSLTKTTAQPMAKRASSNAFCGHNELLGLDPHFDKVRKVLSVERRGKALITKFEGGERWEIVE
ncbi:MAG: hypothetical protein WBZ14_09720 [Terriglobales bacterium]|jgi:hypothetical protein